MHICFGGGFYYFLIIVMAVLTMLNDFLLHVM